MSSRLASSLSCICWSLNCVTVVPGTGFGSLIISLTSAIRLAIDVRTAIRLLTFRRLCLLATGFTAWHLRLLRFLWRFRRLWHARVCYLNGSFTKKPLNMILVHYEFFTPV